MKIDRREFMLVSASAATGALAAKISSSAGKVKEESNHALDRLGEITAKKEVKPYIPAFDETRPLASLRGFPVVRVEDDDTETFVSRLPAELDILIGLIGEHETNGLINPSFSNYSSFTLIDSRYEPLNPPSLLRLLNTMSMDLRTGSARLEVGDLSLDGAIAATRQHYTYTPDDFGLAESQIVFNGGELANRQYPDFSQQANLPLSNLNALCILFYEYFDRVQRIAISFELHENGFWDAYPPRSEADVMLVFQHYFSLKIQSGFRFSAEKNMMQMALQHSIAALAGDESAKVIGMERNELPYWPLYPHYIAALHGDTKAAVALHQDLTTLAAY